MTSRLLICISTILIVASSIYAQAPSSLTEYGRNFMKSVNGVRATYVAATNDIPARYLKDLGRLEEKFQKAGDLDGLLSVKGEVKRFKAAFSGERDPFEAVPEMPAEAFVKAPEALRSLQEGYVASFAEADKDRKASLKELGGKFSAFLDDIQKKLTREGKIEEAIAIRDHSEKIEGFIRKGDFSGLTAAYPSFGSLTTPRSALGTSDNIKAVSRSREGKAGWRSWHHLSNRPFSRDLPFLFDRDLPRDIEADFISATGRGRFVGISRNATRQIGSVLCSWFGSAVMWKVDSPDDLAVAIRVKSRKLTQNLDHGPHMQVAVFVNGKREKLLNVPCYAANDTIRIVRDKNNPDRFALYWPFGRQSETFELPAEVKSLVVLFGVSLHDKGEACDISFQLQDEAN